MHPQAGKRRFHGPSSEWFAVPYRPNHALACSRSAQMRDHHRGRSQCGNKPSHHGFLNVHRTVDPQSHDTANRWSGTDPQRHASGGMPEPKSPFHLMKQDACHGCQTARIRFPHRSNAPLPRRPNGQSDAPFRRLFLRSTTSCPNGLCCLQSR